MSSVDPQTIKRLIAGAMAAVSLAIVSAPLVASAAAPQPGTIDTITDYPYGNPPN